MVNFVKNLFGGKPKDIDQQPKQEKKPAQKKKQEAYFLDADAAKTFGNIEYMRQGTSEKKEPSTLGSAESSFQSQSSSQGQTSETPRRRPDKNMDEFRNMARDMKKK